MNFKTWYNQTLASEHTPEKLRAAEHGWSACKIEVMKILLEGQYNLLLKPKHSGNVIDSDCLAKIEKL